MASHKGDLGIPRITPESGWDFVPPEGMTSVTQLVSIPGWPRSNQVGAGGDPFETETSESGPPDNHHPQSKVS
jgi:hypothetical protein